MIATFDIGGTDIKYGILDNHVHFVLKKTMPTWAHQGGASIVHRIIEVIKLLLHDYPIEGVAISSAGIVEPHEGLILATTDTMKDYAGTPVKKMIEQATGLLTTVENDVNCAALAEATYGKNTPHDFIAMTIGTGIGGAIVTDGQIVHGATFSAGEWGRLLINGIPYEKQASIASLVSHAQQEGLDVKEGKDVFKFYDHGHPIAKVVVNRFYQHLAEGIQNLVYAINPHTIIIGGGISTRGQQFLDELHQALSERLEPYFMKHLSIRLATMKNDSGMLGAYVHYLQQKK